MDYAIIKSGNTKLLEVVKLSEWQEYEWNHFSTVKSVEDGEIKWFWEESEAVEFMLEQFDKKFINPKYFGERSISGEYYIG